LEASNQLNKDCMNLEYQCYKCETFSHRFLSWRIFSSGKMFNALILRCSSNVTFFFLYFVLNPFF